MKLLAVTKAKVAEAIRQAGSKLAGVDVSFVSEGSLTAVLEKSARRPLLTLFSRRAELMRLVGQQRVLEALIGFGPVLPARPDAFIADEAEAHALLQAHGAVLEAQLASYGGTVQYQVTVEGSADVEDPRALVTATLTRASRDLIHLPLSETSMIANAVALIGRGEEELFEDALAEIDAAFDGQCRIRMIGPMPPVSFAAIDVAPFDDRAIEDAARILGVNPAASTDELRRAYLGLVSRCHPDRVGASGNETQVGAASDAYRLLCRYGAARASEGKSRVLSVNVVRQNEAGRRAA